MESRVRLASEHDVESIVKLLKKGKLNVEGIENHIENFLVVEQMSSHQIVGTAGLEVIGEDYGLLRSLVIDPVCLDPKIGMELVRILLSFAIGKGLQEIYFITRSKDFFEYFGCTEVSGPDVPWSIQQSRHFQQSKSDLSTVMVYKKVNNQGQNNLNQM